MVAVARGVLKQSKGGQEGGYLLFSVKPFSFQKNLYFPPTPTHPLAVACLPLPPMVEWGPSVVTEAEIGKMEEDRLVSKDVLAVGWRLSTVGELASMPRDQEIVFFTEFHRLGLGLPLHPFLWGLLFFYGLRLHDQTPEGILHIATFITLCEAFLGIAPHFALWRWVF